MGDFVYSRDLGKSLQRRACGKILAPIEESRQFKYSACCKMRNTWVAVTKPDGLYPPQYGEEHEEKFVKSWFRVPDKVVQTVCRCDIRELMAVGHQAGCPEKRK